MQAVSAWGRVLLGVQDDESVPDANGTRVCSRQPLDAHTPSSESKSTMPLILSAARNVVAIINLMLCNKVPQ